MAAQPSTVHATLTLKNPLGLHARAAALWVRAVSRFAAQVTVTMEGQQVDGRSMLELMTLGAPQGSVIEVEASGVDAPELLAAVAELVKNNFYET